MRELERDLTEDAGHAADTTALPRLAIVGRGRMGNAIAIACERTGLSVETAGRTEVGDACAAAEAALLCVGDSDITTACAAVTEHVPPIRLVGHVSGATPLTALAEAADRGAAVFSMHPLQTVPDPDAELIGSACAVAGSSPEALGFARELAAHLGMRAFEVPEERRAAYHAAASMASNFLVALEESAGELLGATGVDDARALLAPLVLRTAANWAEKGADALTGPIARGDEATIEAHLEALAESAPDLVPLYEALAERTGQGGELVVKTVRTKGELAEALASGRSQEASIGLVPTMGALHDGHLSLLRAARERCDLVVMSLFVNPTQFAPSEDLEAYPRDEKRDLELAGAEGVDVVFAPSAEEMYPDGFATTVTVAGPLTEVLCGDPARRGSEHFDGVTTVVAKLFSLVRPDDAFFGQKDAQQAAVIRRMTEDLDLGVEIVTLPIVREADGLAMSSRNAYLTGEDREQAVAISRALGAAEATAGAGVDDALEAARSELEAAGIEPEYLEARHADDLTPVSSFNGRPVLLAVAARVGKARLIDNVLIGADTGTDAP